METRENSTPSENAEREAIIENLMKIDGIGRKTAEAMVQIGIHSYSDLTHFLNEYKTASDISETLRRNGVNLPAGFIDREKWIKGLQARQNQDVLQRQEKKSKSVKKTEAVSTSQAPFDHDAGFSVFFDVVLDKGGKQILHTTVYNEKNAGEFGDFDGNYTFPWVNWMVERMNLPISMQPIRPQAERVSVLETTNAEIAALPTPRKLLDARLEIENVQISVPEPMSQIPTQRLAAKLKFRLAGNEAEALALNGLSYRAEIHTISLADGVPERVATGKGQLEPGQFEYTLALEFAMPAVGRYAYFSLIHLLPFGDLTAFHWGTTMRIVP